MCRRALARVPRVTLTRRARVPCVLRRAASLQEEKRLTQVREEQEAARAARVVPTEPVKLVEFLLNTTAEEMDFELVRCRPHLVRLAIAAPARSSLYGAFLTLSAPRRRRPRSSST